MSEDVTYLIAEEKWTSLIGRFMMDFASIEDCVHRVIKFYVEKTLIKDSQISENFRVRLELFKAVMAECFIDSDTTEFESTIDEIGRLYLTRNLIAHNSLSYAFEEDKDGNMNFMGFTISARKKANVEINFDSFTEEVSKLKQCRTDLAKYMMQFHVAEFQKTYESASQ